MWTRAELKSRSKNNLRKYFWPALAVSMINALFNSNGGSNGSNGAHTGVNISQEYNFNLSEGLNSDLGSVIQEIPEMAEGVWNSIDPVASSILLIGVLIGAAIALAIGVFVAPVVEVGKNRFYMESRQLGHAAGMDCLVWGFKNDYLNIIWTMLVRNTLVLLGSLCCVIPGVYLAYCYHMVPYILAENPDMRTSDALRMSKEMMQGHKLSTWVLEISFMGWWILGSLACGVGTCFVYPYYDATFAELYAVLRNPYTNYLSGFGAGSQGGYEERNTNWRQPYEQPYYQTYQQSDQSAYEKTYEYSYEPKQTKTEPSEYVEPAVNVEQPIEAVRSEERRPEEGRVRGYYLNGEFHPYTDEELKELEKNGY